MLDTAILLFRRHGYNGTGFRQIVAESGAPRGSMYHHFPGGKTQLGVDAVTLAGQGIEALIDYKLQKYEGDIVTGIEAVWRWWVRHVEEANLAGCPVLAVAVEEHPEAPELTEAAAAVFGSWIAAFARGIERAGLEGEEASEWATFVLSALEGATGIARAYGDLGTLELVGRRVAGALRARLAGRVTP